MATMVQSPSAVAQAYRTLGVLIRRLPTEQQPKALSELRHGFRENSNVSKEEVPALLEAAGKKASFLRIITPKPRDATHQGATTYVYRSNEVQKGGHGTKRQNGRVHTNWDAKNLDPCAVSRHYAGLKRAGFVNNSHAKGIF